MRKYQLGLRWLPFWSAKGKGRGGARKSKPSPPRGPRTDKGSQGPKSAPVDVLVKPSRAPTPAAPAIHRAAAAASRPLEIYAGMFGGKVWVHGAPIRAFFQAVEKGLDDRTLKALAQQVQADATSRAKLVDLHPKDRSIFEAALALA